MPAVHTRFDPQQHAFRFANYFDAIQPINLPFIGAFDIGTLVIGLCGGMCFAALDLFHNQAAAPADTDTAHLRPNLLRYLRSRQADSLGLMTLNRIFHWMLRSDADLIYLTVTRELPDLRARLDAGQPVVLCLLRAGGVANPTLNHQVLATGYDVDPIQRRMSIFLYDPNHPDKQPTLDARWSGARTTPTTAASSSPPASRCAVSSSCPTGSTTTCPRWIPIDRAPLPNGNPLDASSQTIFYAYPRQYPAGRLQRSRARPRL